MLKDAFQKEIGVEGTMEGAWPWPEEETHLSLSVKRGTRYRQTGSQGPGLHLKVLLCVCSHKCGRGEEGLGNRGSAC